MKTVRSVLSIIPLVCVAMLVNAGEATKPEGTAKKETVSPTGATNAASATELTAAEKVRAQEVGKRQALAESVTKAPPTAARSFVQSLNPFAPMEKAPDTPWLSRAAWSTAAASAPKSSEPVEMRHESAIGVVVVSK